MKHPKPTRITTLCLVHKQSKMLLGMKKRGFGEGRWNGHGGKVEGSETLEENVIREMQEECGIVPTKFDKRGLLYFEFKNDPEIIEVNVFSIDEYHGEPVETEEMNPGWFDIDNLPWKDMWPDDMHWYPLFLAGKSFEGNFLFEDQNTIISHKLEEI